MLCFAKLRINVNDNYDSMLLAMHTAADRKTVNQYTRAAEIKLRVDRTRAAELGKLQSQKELSVEMVDIHNAG